MDEQPVVEETKELDAHVPLLAALEECTKSLTFWQARKEKLQAELAEIMGSATVGTVDNRQVLTYRYEERFRGTAFKTAYPDTYRSFVHEVTRKEFDPSWLKQLRPDLYDQFKVRSMKSTWKS
jgi:hypothetical protein